MKPQSVPVLGSQARSAHRRAPRLLGRSLVPVAAIALVACSATTPTHGWDMAAARTGLSGVGVPRASLPSWRGTITPGMTLREVKVTQPLDLSSVPGVTLDRVWLAPVGGAHALTLGPGTVLRDSDVNGSDMQQGERIGIYGNVAGTYSISGVAVSGMSVGAWLDGEGTGTVSRTWIGAMTSINGAHIDGLTRRSGTGSLVVTGTRIDATGPFATGALFLQNTWDGPIGGIELKDTLLEGDGYVLTLENTGAGTSVSLDNVRLRSTGWGPLTAAGSIAIPIWSHVTSSGRLLLPPSPAGQAAAWCTAAPERPRTCRT